MPTLGLPHPPMPSDPPLHCGDSSSDAATRGLWHKPGHNPGHDSCGGAVAQTPSRARAHARTHDQPVAALCPAGGDVSPFHVPTPQGEGRPVAEDGGHRCSSTQPGTPRCRSVRPLPQGFPPPVPEILLQVGSRGRRGDMETWGHRARVARPSPHTHLLAGCARARCATRAPWTWASRGAAACSATSRGTRRLCECRRGSVLRGSVLLRLGHGACGQVLTPQVLGLRCSPHGRPLERETTQSCHPSASSVVCLSSAWPGVGRGMMARGRLSPPRGDRPLAGCPS